MLFESFESSTVRERLSILMRPLLNICTGRVQHLLPRRCLLCDAPTPGGWACDGCARELPYLPPGRCAVCAVPLASATVCGACLRRPPAFDRLCAVFAYEFPVDALIHAFKYGRRLALAPPLGEALAAAGAPPADVLVPVPLGPSRLRERGFNQALELARAVSRRHGVPILGDACRRVADTAPQAALPWHQRAKNVRRAFACNKPLSGLRVAVVDDVVTTGATLNEIAHTLRRAGAVSIVGWVLARTLPR